MVRVEIELATRTDLHLFHTVSTLLHSPPHSITHSLSTPTVNLQSMVHLRRRAQGYPKGYHLVVVLVKGLGEAERRMGDSCKSITR
jgi:hypothetical protein